jgi:hypothetical protein
MYKGLILTLSLVLFALVTASQVNAQVYKVVDEDGNITYTDEPPTPGAQPMELPEISVIETDFVEPVDVSANDEEAEDPIRTLRQLRRDYGDFRILEPQPDQTYWGTGNMVVISWGSDIAYLDDMAVSVVVDGRTFDVESNGNLPVTLDRGEHQVYAILKDGEGRRIITSDVVTFHVKQASRLINPG